MKKNELGKTSMGLEANLAGLLSYVAGWITGLVFYLVEKDNKFVRFHALQSVITFGALSVGGIVLSILFTFLAMIGLAFLTPLFILLGQLIWLLGVVLWILLMVKAYQGEKFKLPIVGDIAEKNI